MYRALEIGSPAASPRGCQPSAGLYTLVFPAPGRDQARSSPRVTFGAACELLRASIPVSASSGPGSDEKRAIGDLKKAWAAKFRAASPLPNDSVPSNLLFELLRELVIARLEGVEGLQMTSAACDGRILVHLHPSPELLAAAAERMKFPVPIMREIDPGRQYWSAEEARQREKQVWERPAAQEELYRLFLAGKIPAEDARLFDEDEGEDMGMWSRRIHAIYRFSDPAVAEIVQSSSPSSPLSEMLPPKLETVTYLPFAKRASLHYLYRQIDGAPSSSPFRHVDQIRIARAIVEEQFNIDTLVTSGVLLGHFCAHSHHTDAIDTSIEALQSQWGHILGSFRICGRLVELPRWRFFDIIVLAWKIPAFQPLQHIRNYFGEQIALYFGFASCFALKLQSLVVLSFLLNLLGHLDIIHSASPFSVDHFSLIVFAIANCVIARIFEKRWIFKEKKLAATWGTNHNFAVSTHDRRPRFNGQLQRSEIDHRFAPFYSPRRRLIKQLLTSTALLALVALVLGANFMLVTSSHFQQFSQSSRLNVSLSNVVIAALGRCLASPSITYVVEVLTEWENHETHESHDAALTLKYALAQSANAFSVLGYYAFARSFSSEDCNREQTRMSCQEQAADLLEIALALDLVLALLFAFSSNIFGKIKAHVALLRHRSSYKRLEQPRKLAGRARPDKLRTPLTMSSTSTTSFVEYEVFMPQYGGVLDAYARLVLPFGYVAGFALLAPLVAPTIAWATTLTHMKMDAFTLTHSVQRPFPHTRTSIGSWQGVLGLFSLASTALNAAFVAQALRSDSSGPSGNPANEIREETTRLAIYTAFALLWWVLGLSSHWNRVDEKRLALASTRSEFLRRKYLSKMTGSKTVDLVTLLPSSGRVFLNGVFRFLVTGDKLEEDAADELYDQTRVQQRRGLEVEASIAELRAALGSKGQVARIGTLFVEVLGVNVFPPGVDAFIELQLIQILHDGSRNTAAGESGASRDEGDSAAAGDGASFNTSVGTRVAGRAPQWHESFEIPIKSLEHMLELRVVDAATPMLGSKRGRKRLGVAKVSVVEIIDRCLGSGLDSPSRGGGALAPVVPGDEVIMASYELPLDVPDAFLTAIRRSADQSGAGAVHGHPRLTVRCGVRLEELGTLLVALRKQQRRLAELRAREARFLAWEE